MKRALLTAITGAALLLILNRGGVPVEAQAADPLKFFKNFFITGDYVAAGVGLRNTGDNGIATGTINIAGVPAGADIQAAYLYWQVVSTNSLGPDSGNAGVTFRGNPLETPAGPMGKVLGAFGSAPCWASGGSTGPSGGSKRTYTYRADVLRFFGVDGEGKIEVNGPHIVQAPDSGGNGNATPIALGASLVVVYRSPDANAPLSAVVIYDGSHTVDNGAKTLTQTIKGFYQPASTSPNARITYIGGSGQANKNENVFFDGNLLAASPFTGASDTGWDTLTYSNLNPGPDGAVTTTVDTANVSSSDCLTFGAMVFKTAVQDTDDDGLVDVWETEGSEVKDPHGVSLPPLYAMGARVGTKDIFVEIGYMKTVVGTSYGGGPDKDPHSHLPSYEALKLVGDSFAKEPGSLKAPGGYRVHFDVGPQPQAYFGNDWNGGAPAYIVPAQWARGGDAIDEMKSTLCTETGQPWDCQFKAYPGTVGWKTGFRYLKDEVLSDELAPAPGEDDVCDAPGATCERRFDRNRKDIFHYALFAHALGLPKSESPCKNSKTGELKAAVGDACGAGDIVNPDFRTPRTTTGVGDFPGGDVLVTLGAFADTAGLPIGTPFMQASTLMHELGHNFERRHSGEQSTSVSPNPNCKPTYLSVMNYLYQLRGLLDNQGRPHLDFSGSVGVELNEGALQEGAVMGSPYRIGWYAPLVGSYLQGRGTAAKSHCDGSALLPGETAMVRIDARHTGDGIDWAADGIAPTLTLDINFNGRTTLKADGTGGSELLRGSNDWANIRLNQVGARRSAGGLYVIDERGTLRLGAMSLDAGRGDYGRGDYGRGDYGRGDYGRGDYGRGDLGRGDYGRGDYGRGDYGRGDYGRGDYGRGDYGGGDLFTGDPNNIGGELDFELAGDLAKTPPNEFTACVVGIGTDCPTSNTSLLHDVKVTFKAPNVGGVFEFIVYRVVGAEVTPALVDGKPVTPAWTEVGSTLATGLTDYTVVDRAELVDGQKYTYFAVAVYADAVKSDASNLVTITAVNAPLTAGADAFSVDEDATLKVPANGVLGNDLDPDSPTGALSAALVAGPSRGSLTFNANGSFDYTPAENFFGEDTFTYKATAGSVTTAAATVTITVAPVNDLPVAKDDSAATDEDTPVTIAVLANDSDADGDALTATVVTDPAHGAVTLNAGGSFVYTPAANYHGPDSFTYYARDGSANSNPVTVTIVVGPVNDAPTADADSAATDEDTPVTIAVLANDSDVDGDALTAVLVSGPANGAVTLGAGGSFVYTPAANFFGEDTFTYYARDGSANSATVMVTIAVASVDDLPLAGNDTLTVAEDSGTSNGNLATNDTPSGDGGNVWSLTTPAAHGTAVVNADGTYSYTPNANYNGADSFTYTLTDVDGDVVTATVTITVTSVNDLPAAVDDTLTVDEDSGTSNGNLATNDTPSDDGGNVWARASGATHGTAVVNADGTFSYTPNANYNGADSFTYTLTDANGDDVTATVAITVNSVDDLPVAANDGLTVAEDSGTSTGSLATNDTPSGDGGNVWALATGAARGTAVVNANGSYSYAPNANYNGADSFTYTLTDADGDVSTATVTITVTSVNDAPVAGNDAYTTIQGSALTIVAPGVLGNDSDIDGTLTAVLASGPANGAVTVNANGSFTYTPGAGFYGTDSFSYNAWDGTNGTTATVALTVTPLTYVFTGFLSPMVTAGTEGAPTNAGVFSYGKAIPLKWSLTQGGAVVSNLASLKTLVAVSGTYTADGRCDTTGGTTLQLLDPTGRPTGNSTYRFGSGQFIFNWDTSAASKTSCYVIKLTLNDGTAAKATFIRFR